jgi:hypothetical protein
LTEKIADWWITSIMVLLVMIKPVTQKKKGNKVPVVVLPFHGGCIIVCVLTSQIIDSTTGIAIQLGFNLRRHALTGARHAYRYMI